MNTLGTLPSQDISAFVTSGAITGARPIVDGQIQPATLDLTLGTRGWRTRASVLPRPGESMRDLLTAFALYELDLTQPTILEKETLYVLEVNESLALPADIRGTTEAKSSTGRVDLQTRLLVDGVSRFDRVTPGYHGPLYVEVTSRSFLVSVQAGLALNQLRLFRGNGDLTDAEITTLHATTPLLCDTEGRTLDVTSQLDNGILLSVDLQQERIGWRARRTNEVLSLVTPPVALAERFFEPLFPSPDGELTLAKDDFVILSTREGFRVPPEMSVQMVPYDVASGEFRSHYAGFFDPGWGFGDGSILGTPAVLEVRSHGDDVLLRHGQPICTMAFTRCTARPERVYGAGNILGSHYVRQKGPQLSKYLRS